MEINGIAHIFVTAGDFARSRAFYAKLLPFLGMRPVLDAEGFYYCVGGRTAFGLRPASAGHAGQRFDQGRVGLHHVCFRARSREDVEAVHELVRGLGAAIVHAPEEGTWAPGYYSVLFEDPDGIRLEVNFVPGRGLLEPGARFAAGARGPSGTAPPAMDDLRRHLEALHAELAHTGEVEPAARAGLEAVLRDIRGLLARSEAEAQAGHASLSDRLREAGRHFEESHPTLTATVGRVIDALAALGI